MPTLNQLCSKARQSRSFIKKAPALEQCPQKKGVCLRVFTRTPKKPNSAFTNKGLFLLNETFIFKKSTKSS